MSNEETTTTTQGTEPAGNTGGDSKGKDKSKGKTRAPRKPPEPFTIEVWAGWVEQEDESGEPMPAVLEVADPDEEDGTWMGVPTDSGVGATLIAPVPVKDKGTRDPSADDVTKRIADAISEDRMPAGKYRIFRIAREFTAAAEVARKVTLS